MAPDDWIDVVVCHYNRWKWAHVRQMTLYAVAFLCKTPAEESRLTVTVADGSPDADLDLEGGLRGLGVRYLHAGKELSFAQTYNLGIRAGTSPVVFTLANDILIEARQVRMLADEICPAVGCAIPYLTSSDYGAQRIRTLPVPRRCFPTRMTLNANAFSREALERVGLFPEEMTGCYNDVVLVIRLREDGYSLVLRNVGRVIHLGQQTLKTLSSSVSYEADEALFAKRYAQYWRRGTPTLSKAAQRWPTRVAYRMVEGLPIGWVRKLSLWDCVWAIEPYISAESGTYKEGVRRAFYALMPKRAGEKALQARQTTIREK